MQAAYENVHAQDMSAAAREEVLKDLGLRDVEVFFSLIRTNAS